MHMRINIRGQPLYVSGYLGQNDIYGITINFLDLSECLIALLTSFNTP